MFSDYAWIRAAVVLQMCGHLQRLHSSNEICESKKHLEIVGVHNTKGPDGNRSIEERRHEYQSEFARRLIVPSVNMPIIMG